MTRREKEKGQVEVILGLLIAEEEEKPCISRKSASRPQIPWKESPSSRARYFRYGPRIPLCLQPFPWPPSPHWLARPKHSDVLPHWLPGFLLDDGARKVCVPRLILEAAQVLQPTQSAAQTMLLIGSLMKSVHLFT